MRSIRLKPQIIKKNGRNEFVVLPYAEYLLLREKVQDAEDLLALRKAKREDDPAAPGLTLGQLKADLGISRRGGRARASTRTVGRRTPTGRGR